MRIDVGSANHAASLRDYFLRLGAVAHLGDGSTVDVQFPDDPINGGEKVEDHLRSWVQANNVSATIVPQLARRGPSPEPLQPLLQPAQLEAPPRLGDLLVAKGFITPEQLAYAVVEARKEGELLGRLLLRYEWVFESELARVLAQQWKLPYLNLESIGVDRELVKLLPAEVGTRGESQHRRSPRRSSRNRRRPHRRDGRGSASSSCRPASSRRTISRPRCASRR